MKVSKIILITFFSLWAFAVGAYAEPRSLPEEIKTAFIKYHETSDSKGIRSLFCESSAPKFVREFTYKTIEETFGFRVVSAAIKESKPSSGPNNQGPKRIDKVLNVELTKEVGGGKENVILNLPLGSEGDSFCYLYQ
jgi:hypothetical protein